jgi:uncharacterized protein
VNTSTNTYVSNRVLKLNVGFLLSLGPGNSRDLQFDIPEVRIADDLQVNHVRGPLRISRTKEGLLLQGTLEVGVQGECSRCLDPVMHNLLVEVEELYTYPPTSYSEFNVGDDGILDLGPLLRAEVLIATSKPMLCQLDCKGLCPDCGANLNHSVCTCDMDSIDPRFAALKKLLDTNS